MLSVLLLLPLAACDSDPGSAVGKTSFLVRYEAEGSCASIISVGYTADLGSTVGASITLPWSLERTIDTSAATSTTPAAVGLAVTCLGSAGANNTATARIFVDGELKDERSTSSSDTFIVSVSAPLR